MAQHQFTSSIFYWDLFIQYSAWGGVMVEIHRCWFLATIGNNSLEECVQNWKRDFQN